MESKCPSLKLVGGICDYDKRYPSADTVPLSSCKRGLGEYVRGVGIFPPRLNLFVLSRSPSSFRFFAARNSALFPNAICDKEFQDNICYVVRGVS